MPRKISYGVDYDDGYDYDEDYPDESYDYNYNNGVDEPESGWDSPEIKPEVKKEIIRQNVWRCPICTYDNEDYMSSCDICGVLRNPLIRSSNNGQSSTVGGICMNSGASVMAKSLFSSSPCRLKDASSTKEDIFSHLHGNMRGQFHDLHKAIVSEKHYKINIAPFKFDISSPDDLVTMGLRSYRIGSKVAPDLNKPSTSNAPSNKTINNGNSKSIAKHSAMSSTAKPSSVSAPLNSKDKFQHVEENNHASVSEPQTHSLSSEMTSLTMSVKSDNSKIPDKAKVPRSQFKPENWMLPDQTKDSLTQLNLAIVGHVDSGKSTLSGRLLHLLGQISQKQMHKYEKEAKAQGKGSFAYAWAMDESAEERERGVTMTVAVAYFNSNKYHVVVLDSPGHRDFVPNLISGATQADAAILVIDASIGAFEAVIEIGGGQTREHAQLIRSFGADQLIVCVNKMDAVQYSKERFNAIKLQLGTFLRSCNYRDSSVSWVPLSAMENQNLVGPASDSRLLSWYKGPSLLEAIDALQPPAREYSKPLLMPICDVLKLTSQGQVSVCGKLDAGALRNGSKNKEKLSHNLSLLAERLAIFSSSNYYCYLSMVLLYVLVPPSGDIATVRSLEHFPVAVSNHLELKILVLDVQIPIMIGSQLEFHIHHAKEAARVTKMVSLLDSKTGKVTKKSPRFLLAKQSAIVEVVLQDDVCVDEFSSSRGLGRVFLRSSGTTVAVGVVTRVIPSEQN
ncbi:HBS1-like protein [Artemisia annua]|uniref:HBS1-like protein n=1 Tax=Artemisia annua TaxID=35608 RepID=A0A2U1NCR9_ARTAN|nr:HBS1-like protein [Artemisia annua]